jgi:hypothetical protein
MHVSPLVHAMPRKAPPHEFFGSGGGVGGGVAALLAVATDDCVRLDVGGDAPASGHRAFLLGTAVHPVGSLCTCEALVPHAFLHVQSVGAHAAKHDPTSKPEHCLNDASVAHA